MLINAIKDVAKALSDLIGATKGAASKPADDPSMYQLKGAAKVWERICFPCQVSARLPPGAFLPPAPAFPQTPTTGKLFQAHVVVFLIPGAAFPPGGELGFWLWLANCEVCR